MLTIARAPIGPAGAPVRRRFVSSGWILGCSIWWLTACHIEEPFVRDNHWDSSANVSKTLVGPDSTFSVGDTISVTLTTDPPLPPGGFIVWDSNKDGEGQSVPEAQVWPAGDGKFEVRKATAYYQHIAVGARFDDEVVAWRVWVGQRVRSLRMFCGTANAQVPCDATPIPVGANRIIRVLALDANGHRVDRLEFLMPSGLLLSRAPSVATTLPTLPNREGTVTVLGLTPGTAWIVMRLESSTDSVRVVVTP